MVSVELKSKMYSSMKIMNLANFGYKENTSCWLDMVTTPTSTHKFIKVSYTINTECHLYVLATHGHPHGRALQRMDMSRYCEGLWTKSTYIKYWVLTVNGLKYIYKYKIQIHFLLLQAYDICSI